MRTIKIICIVLICTFCIQATAQEYAITNVTIIPMDKKGAQQGQTVWVKNGIIHDIADAGKIKLPQGITSIDGTGKYLMPGLFDMHAHFFYEQGMKAGHLPNELKVMLANGVTTARIMNGSEVYKDLRERVKAGELAGPQLFVTSPQLLGAWPWKDTVSPKEVVTDAATAEAAVKKFRQQGYDEIKITFFVKPAAYDAIIKTAKEQNIKVTGHVGPDVKLPKALAAGQQIEHLDEFIEMLLSDTLLNRGVSVSGTNIWQKKAWQTVDYLDESKIPALVKMVKDAKVYVTPTQYFFRANFAVGQTDDEIRSSPDYGYIPASLKKDRQDTRNFFWKAFAPDSIKRARFFSIRKQMIKQLQAAGVKLMSGSDSPEWFMVQGFALHKELEALAEAGLTNWEVLQTATVNPATYLGVYSSRGSVTKGKQAEMILLNKNPLDDIRNTTSIHTVFNGKNWYNREKLDAMLSEAKPKE